MMDPTRRSVAGLCAAALIVAWPAGAGAQDPLERGLDAVEDVLRTLDGVTTRGARPDHTIVIEGTGGGTRYTISGGGSLRQVEGRVHGIDATVDRNDRVRGDRAEGGVQGGADAFLVRGSLPDIVLSNPRAADIVVDGEPYHTVVIDGRAGRPGQTGYTISGGGWLEQVDGALGGLGVTAQREDRVSGRRATGTVAAGLDGYRVFGALPEVRLDRPARAAVIVDQVRRGGGGSGGGGGGLVRDHVSIEFDTDRPGGDYRDFATARANPNRCANQCDADRRCEAFTYVPPGVQGPDAHCWLKDEVPAARRRAGMVSGVKRSPLPQNVNTDRPGGDYRDFAMNAAEPTRCAAACAREGRCRAYTYVPPGLQGAAAHCWLKDRPTRRERSEGLVSGSK